MPDTSDSSSAHRTGALSRLLATPPSKEPEVGPETLLSAVLDAATDGIILVSADGRVLTYNDRWEWDFKTYLIELTVELHTARTEKKRPDRNGQAASVGPG